MVGWGTSDFDGDGQGDIIAWADGWFLWLFRGIPGGLDEPRTLLNQEIDIINCDDLVCPRPQPHRLHFDVSVEQL